MLPTLFESALQTLMGRPFGWLIVADPTDLIDAETAELREPAHRAAPVRGRARPVRGSRAERRLAELDAFREAGLWNVRVLAGAATEQDLRLIAPVLVGSADLSAHPYRLRCPDGAQEFADVLATKLADPADGSTVPFAATAGALAALTGLPRREVPGVRVLRPGYFDVTSEVPAGPAMSSSAGSWTARTGRSERSCGSARHAEPARLGHGRDRCRQVADGPAPAASSYRAPGSAGSRSSRSSPSTRPWQAQRRRQRRHQAVI